MFQNIAFKFSRFNYAAIKWLGLLLFLLVLTPKPYLNPEKPSINFVEFERDEKLQAETDALLPLFDEMPSVRVFVKDEPVLKSASNVERGVAYTKCENPENPAIFVKKIFYEKTNRKQLVNILKHELTHAWLCRQNLMSGHDELFRRKFTEVGGFGN